MSELIAKVEAMRQKALKKAEDNRRRMPTVAAWVDDAKKHFGADQVKVGFASENGITLGDKTPDGVRMSETVVGPWNKPINNNRRK